MVNIKGLLVIFLFVVIGGSRPSIAGEINAFVTTGWPYNLKIGAGYRILAESPIGLEAYYQMINFLENNEGGLSAVGGGVRLNVLSDFIYLSGGAHYLDRDGSRKVNPYAGGGISFELVSSSYRLFLGGKVVFDSYEEFEVGFRKFF